MHSANETLSPVDLEDVDGYAALAGLGWASAAIAVAALLLAATNAVTIRDWANELTPSPTQERLSDAAEQWVAITDDLGLGAPRATMHGWWKQAQALTIGGAR
ncbi:hypothetical protein PQ455_10025 [Sphingomonas naphthae]|uniref:Uncharacterized protein n=1 Tax=Sphingomonas naphthae TaxID=1813468 RepID=A0ABY7TFG8_9SPHN|nr:hypothetical protein [Sphingomonas naphthae]WCT71986.1 hypothetical protein PQ455_10025 [Sphingomonas naphthae]